MTPRFFATGAAFGKWLAANHQKRSELLVGFYKVDSGKPSMTWKESVDEALCHGWIDGVRRRIDDASYSIRFTPRRKTSIWSAVNIRRFAELESEGRMKPAGRAIFAVRDPKKTNRYSFEVEKPQLSPEFAAELAADAKAARTWDGEAPWYRRTASHWVMSAKKEATRRSRMDTLVADCRAGRRIKAVPAPAPASASAATKR